MAMDDFVHRIQQSDRGAKWPGGECIDLAILPINADFVVSTLGFSLDEGIEEGLGSWQATGMRLESGEVVEIVEYIDRPGPRGFILRVDAASSLGSVLDEVIQVFGLFRTSLPWVSPRIGEHG